MNALDGIRILDLSRVLAGPWCTQTLADLGADVVKVERPPGPNHPGGDDTRSLPPQYDGEATVFLAVNRNKRSILLDTKKPEGREALMRLVEAAESGLRCRNHVCLRATPQQGSPHDTRTSDQEHLQGLWP